MLVEYVRQTLFVSLFIWFYILALIMNFSQVSLEKLTSQVYLLVESTLSRERERDLLRLSIFWAYILVSRVYQIEKCQHLAYLNLSLYILVPTTEGHPSFRVTPIEQDGHQYTLLLISGIISILRLVVIVNKKHKLCSLWNFVGPEQFWSPKVKQYKVKSVYI